MQLKQFKLSAKLSKKLNGKIYLMCKKFIEIILILYQIRLSLPFYDMYLFNGDFDYAQSPVLKVIERSRNHHIYIFIKRFCQTDLVLKGINIV